MNQIRYKYKYYSGDWCLVCDIFMPRDSGKIIPVVCKECNKNARQKVKDMNEYGVYLAIKKS